MIMNGKPRLGFVGVGWIGRNRMEAVVRSGLAEIVWIQDVNPQLCAAAREMVPSARIFDNGEEWTNRDIDGVFIATPSALHVRQSVQALDAGIAVFCQKPLGRNALETAEVVKAARKNDKLRGVDFSYRHTRTIQAVKQVLDSGELGEIYAMDLVFHNGYGPDKPWYYDPELSGGGCLVDLGIHLVDLVLWLFDSPELNVVQSHVFSRGKLLAPGTKAVEDYVTAQLLFSNAISVRLACSWNLPAGRDAVIKAVFYGQNGGVSFSNIDGSFYDFVAHRFHGTSTQMISNGPDDWGGRTAVDWVEKLSLNSDFDDESFHYVEVARVLDAIYGR
ncbi:Predicted dehydrogenase [Desulfonatronum thiosulfatophilum]|uniref:Predicted dehydrogenase n=1 Tax=Desulfonatronum thiosulfatophilum TaxID=617002 RepID=A0A1G6BCN9_9BACT|nr:Gfo/Idh/MocA family oxidoreductase [Desulfonatronum thiosulfatophilum]SDB18299.1 Predicted dehydrogenase [Desulfonatronum thiosulfatophilum]